MYFFIFFLLAIQDVFPSTEPFFCGDGVIMRNMATGEKKFFSVKPYASRHSELAPSIVETLKKPDPSNLASARLLLVVYPWVDDNRNALKDAKRNYLAGLLRDLPDQYSPQNIWDAFGVMMLYKKHYPNKWQRYRDAKRSVVENFWQESPSERSTLIGRELAIDRIDDTTSTKTVTRSSLFEQLNILHTIGQKGDAIAALYCTQFLLKKNLHSVTTPSLEDKEKYLELLKVLFSLPLPLSHTQCLKQLAIDDFHRHSIEDLAAFPRSEKHTNGRYQGFVEYMQSLSLPQ